MRTYLLDKFEIDMLKEYPSIVMIDEVPQDEFCLDIDLWTEDGILINGITNPVTLREIKNLCGVDLGKGEEIVPKLEKYDKVLLIQRYVGKTRFFEIRVDE